MSDVYASVAICCSCGFAHMKKPTSCDCGNDESLDGFEPGVIVTSDDYTTLRQQLTAAQAENEALRRELDKVRGKLSGWRDRFRREYAKGGGHDSWLLRKQAEAVDEAREHMLRDAARGTGMNVDDANAWLKVKVQWLRDEAERAGGEQ